MVNIAINVSVNIDSNWALVDGNATALGFKGTATKVIGSTFATLGGSNSKLIATSATE